MTTVGFDCAVPRWLGIDNVFSASIGSETCAIGMDSTAIKVMQFYVVRFRSPHAPRGRSTYLPTLLLAYEIAADCTS